MTWNFPFRSIGNSSPILVVRTRATNVKLVGAPLKLTRLIFSPSCFQIEWVRVPPSIFKCKWPCFLSPLFSLIIRKSCRFHKIFIYDVRKRSAGSTWFIKNRLCKVHDFCQWTWRFHSWKKVIPLIARLEEAPSPKKKRLYISSLWNEFTGDSYQVWFWPPPSQLSYCQKRQPYYSSVGYSEG